MAPETAEWPCAFASQQSTLIFHEAKLFGAERPEISEEWDQVSFNFGFSVAHWPQNVIFRNRHPLAASQHDPICMLERSAAPPPALTEANQRGRTVMAQTARNNEAEKAADNVAEIGRRAADKGT